MAGFATVVPEPRPAARFDVAEPLPRDLRVSEPRPEPAGRAAPDPAPQAEPLVQIGSIEIIIEAPPPAPPAGGHAPAPVHFASRYYLRGL